MKAVRVLLLLVVALASAVAVSGFWSAHALNDSAGYADDMAVAWRDVNLQVELQEDLTAAATEQIYAYFDVTGPDQNFLADTAVSLATSSIASNLASGEFALAWREWHYQLHEDLDLIVEGGTPQTTRVDGSVITVDISPLASVLLSGRIGGLIAEALGDDLMIRQIDTGYDVEAQLDWFGRLVAARWWAAGLALACGAATAWLWRPLLRGAAAALGVAAIGCAAAALWRFVTGPGSGGQDGSALSAAVSDALVGSWDVWLFAASVVGALGAAALLVLDRRTNERRRNLDTNRA